MFEEKTILCGSSLPPLAMDVEENESKEEGKGKERRVDRND